MNIIDYTGTVGKIRADEFVCTRDVDEDVLALSRSFTGQWSLPINDSNEFPKISVFSTRVYRPLEHSAWSRRIAYNVAGKFVEKHRHV